MITTEFGQNLTPSIPEVQTREHAWDSFVFAAAPAGVILLHNILYLNGFLPPNNGFQIAPIVRLTARVMTATLAGVCEFRREKIHFSPVSLLKIAGISLIASTVSAQFAVAAGFDEGNEPTRRTEDILDASMILCGVACYNLSLKLDKQK